MTPIRIARFIGLTVSVSVILFCGLLFVQPKPKVRIELKESHDRFGTRCVDVYLTNLTTEKMELDESMPADTGDVYGGIWNTKSSERVTYFPGFMADWWRADMELEKKYHKHIENTQREFPTTWVAPGERKQISSVYVLSKYSKPALTIFQLGYQPSQDRVHWSNSINVVPVKITEIKGIDIYQG